MVLRAFRLIVLSVALALAGVLGTLWAAAPLAVGLLDVQIYRHVLETGDWLVLGRYELIPTTPSNLNLSDGVTADVTSGDFDQPVTLTNRVVSTSVADFTVTVDADSSDITSTCTLQTDSSSIDCTTTGLADGSHALTVAYRGGWTAYGGTDAFYRLVDGSTVVDQRTLPATGYRLVALYLDAAAVTANSLTWADAGITVQLRASPVLWDVPDTDSVTPTWNATADLDATVNTLTTGLRNMLRALEVADPDISTGDYVTPTGIPDAGLTVAQDAFASFPRAIPEAFLSTAFIAFEDRDATETPAFVTTIETAAGASTIGTNWTDVGNLFGGISGGAAGTIVFSIIALIVGIVGLVRFQAPAITVFAVWVVFTLGWLLGAMADVWVFMPAALLGGWGVFNVARRVFG